MSIVVNQVGLIPVRLTAGSVHLPIMVEKLSFVHDWRVQRCYGDPKDWQASAWRGGQVTITGGIIAVENGVNTTFNLLTYGELSSIVVGSFRTLWGCRRLSARFEMNTLDERVKQLNGSIVYAFKAYS